MITILRVIADVLLIVIVWYYDARLTKLEKAYERLSNRLSEESSREQEVTDAQSETD